MSTASLQHHQDPEEELLRKKSHSHSSWQLQLLALQHRQNLLPVKISRGLRPLLTSVVPMSRFGGPIDSPAMRSSGKVHGTTTSSCPTSSLPPATLMIHEPQTDLLPLSPVYPNGASPKDRDTHHSDFGVLCPPQCYFSVQCCCNQDTRKLHCASKCCSYSPVLGAGLDKTWLRA